MYELDLRGRPFSLDCTLACGQVFRWNKYGSVWKGIVEGRAIQIQKAGDILEVEVTPSGLDANFFERYFRLQDDLPKIYWEISRDNLMLDTTRRLIGLRLIRQDPWECLASYICSSYNNVPRIKGIIQRLCKRFGEKIPGQNVIYGFPPSSRLSNSTTEEMMDCGLGYRAQYLLDTAKIIVKEGVNLESLRRVSYEEAKNQLMHFPGVGNKVADCVCLFSLDKLEAFPVDVWIRRIMISYYSQQIYDISLASLILNPREYKLINSFGRQYFGRYAGYAQQYLYTRHSRVMKKFPSYSE